MVEATAVRAAIDGRHIVTLVYRGKKRTVIPLVLMQSDGKETLEAWQIAATGSGQHNWRAMRLDEIEAFKHAGTFQESQIPAGYNPDRYHDKVCWVPISL